MGACDCVRTEEEEEGGRSGGQSRFVTERFRADKKGERENVNNKKIKQRDAEKVCTKTRTQQLKGREEASADRLKEKWAKRKWRGLGYWPSECVHVSVPLLFLSVFTGSVRVRNKESRASLDSFMRIHTHTHTQTHSS